MAYGMPYRQDDDKADVWERYMRGGASAPQMPGEDLSDLVPAAQQAVQARSTPKPDPMGLRSGEDADRTIDELAGDDRRWQYDDPYGEDKREALERQLEASQLPAWRKFLIAFGGGDPTRVQAADPHYANIASRLQSFDARKQAAENAARQRVLDQRAATDYAQAQADREEENDTSSATSRMYQAIASKMVPNVDWSQVPAARIKQVLPSTQSIYSQEQQNARNASDNEEAYKRAQLQKRKGAGGAGKNPKPQLSAEDIEIARKDPTAFIGALQARGLSFEAASDMQKKAAAMKAPDAAPDQDPEKAVPGWQQTGEVTPTKVEAQKLREAEGTKRGLQAQLANYKNLISKYGTIELTGTGSAKLENAYNTILLNLKELEKLGVLTGPDVGLLTAELGDPPNSWGSVFSRNKTSQDKLDALFSDIETRHKNKMESAGYVKGAGKPGKASAPARPGTSQGSGKILVSNGKETLEIDASDLKDAESDGYKRVR